MTVLVGGLRVLGASYKDRPEGVLTHRKGQLNNDFFVSLLDKVSKNAPAGSDVAVAAVKSMLAAANSAYDNMNKVAKQATEIAEANVAAATETVKGLAKAKKVA